VTDHDDATVDDAKQGGGLVLPPSADPVDDARGELAEQLVEEARATGVSLVGPDGLLADIIRRVLETGLEVEMSDHLGYDRHAPEGRDGGNSRNGARSKTVLTEVGPVEIAVPRDRHGSFEPATVRKRQRRLQGVDGMVISLCAKGLTTGEIVAHLAEVYGAEVSRETISKITDAVLEEMSGWLARPLDGVYPVVFIDAIHVKVRDGQVANRAFYSAIGVTMEGKRDILGIWASPGDEGARFWLGVLTELRNRGVATCASWCATGSKACPTPSPPPGPWP
jgi:putative transposase